VPTEQRRHRHRESEAIPRATPEDVAALLTARTKDKDGNEVGTWTEDTRPTAEQVAVRIDIARSLVLKEAGGLIPEECLEGAESAVALKAAMITEAAFWPEQTESNQSTFQRLQTLYEQAYDGLLACVAIHGAPSAYELDVSGQEVVVWPFDWWQRNLDQEP
jgi:hypothetical protein